MKRTMQDIIDDINKSKADQTKYERRVWFLIGIAAGILIAAIAAAVMLAAF